MKIKSIDLFAGIGGTRLGFEQACKSLNINHECVLTSEVKSYALEVLKDNFSHKKIVGDITKIDSEEIPDFDILFAGFPCQPFSSGGKRLGFSDTRGTLFFDIERILEAKKPHSFLLENVEGMVRHDLKNKHDKIGNTLNTILDILENKLNYNVSWKVINSLDFGVPQQRKRIYILGSKNSKIKIDQPEYIQSKLSSVLQEGLPSYNSFFVEKLLKQYKIEDLYGKQIKDTRGGPNNIHTWDFELRGPCSSDEKLLLNTLFKERRKKHWAKEIGIAWQDGMPLTKDQISTFFKRRNLQSMLDNLVNNGYLNYIHPKDLVTIETKNGFEKVRKFALDKPKGYSIVAGKLNLEINNILSPEGFAPTLVATDMHKLFVPDKGKLRKISYREGLRMFGYPDSFKMPLSKESQVYDLLGNTIVVPVVNYLSQLLIEDMVKSHFLR